MIECAHLNKIFNFVLNEVVLWIECAGSSNSAFFLMTDVSNTEHTRLLHDPIKKLLTENLIVRLETNKILV